MTQPRHLNVLIDCIKRVRNNLFHGGKYGCNGFESPQRSLLLIESSIAILEYLKRFLEAEID